MQIHIPHGHHYYTTFYVLAILTLVLGALAEGWRRNFPLRPWLVLLAGYLLAFIVGTKLITMPLAAWGPLLCEGHWPLDPARSVLGGSLLGSLVLLALHRWLGLGRQVFDALAWPLGAALAVQCVGCVLTGCCFGEVSGAGLVYAAGTPPWAAQVAAGFIPATAPVALPVLPTQLLALLLCAGTAGVLWLTRQRRWPVGSRALLSAGLLLLGRGLLEFWRNPAGEPVGAQVLRLGGMSLLAVQWVLLPVGLLALAAWAWYKGRAVAAPAPLPAVRPVRHLLVLTALLLVAALLGPGTLVLPEVLVVKALLLAVLAMEAGAWLLKASTLQAGGSPAWLRAPLGLAAVLLLLTSQTTPTDSARAANRPPVSTGLTISAGAQQNNYEDNQGGGCGGGPRYQYRHQATVAGTQAAYRFNTNQDGAPSTVGLGVWLGNDRINLRVQDASGLNTDTTFHRSLFAVHPFVAGERRRLHGFEFGYRAGLYVGKLNAALNDYFVPETRVSLAPDVMVWWGKRRSLYGQVELGYGPALLGPYSLRIGAGSGLGSTKGGGLGVGVAAPVFISSYTEEPLMGYLNATINLPNTGISLEPYAATNFNHFHQISLRLHYRLGERK